ncbi:MAG: Acetyltransferase domain [Bacteroidota bacterium]|jgi:N-acetylglutamate synthase-like GNAT family acetyltransferase|nr:Acetyltransferase domain [Bacteroidota bacterium]
MKLELRQPSDTEFQPIIDHIKEYELDDRDLKPEQFLAAYTDNGLAGFGRLKHHPDCYELCSLGVITPLRHKGIGKAIVAGLIKRCPEDLYLTCIIPSFFEPFGFITTENPPESILKKLEYCTNCLCVPEKYVAMVLERP